MVSIDMIVCMGGKRAHVWRIFPEPILKVLGRLLTIAITGRAKKSEF